MTCFLNAAGRVVAVWSCLWAVSAGQDEVNGQAEDTRVESAEDQTAIEQTATVDQEGVAAARSPELSSDSVPGPARAEFDKVFAEWKNLLKDLRDLQHRFSTSGEREMSTIRNQYSQKIQQGQLMVERLRKTGVRAYAEAPSADRELTRFLVKLAADDVAHDRHDQAWEICEVMMQFDLPDISLYDSAGSAAYATHRFDLAKEYLQLAKSNGLLKAGEAYLLGLDDVRQAWEKEQEIRETEAKTDDLPRVRLKTNKGDIVVELFENEAPGTVGNFIALVEKGYYDGLVFHRVLSGFVAQGGCPLGDGTGGPDYNIYCECYRDDYRKHFRGSLSMAKSADRDTGGSQFFLTFRPTPHLNGQHTVFGRVIEGMNVLQKLQRRNPDDSTQIAITPDRIVEATVMRKRGHEYKPNKVQ